MGNDEDFDCMLSFVSKKKIVPIIDQIFNLNDSVKAFEKMKEGKQMGKIVIRVTQ
jgi:D-arabinose 1-dehydrogenase-like Zn-dependent alcohol dehydrogenase